MSDDPFDLERFVTAQDQYEIDATGGATDFQIALAELRAGCKQEHWIWFVFPQFAGLGTSDMAVRYAIGSVDEARAYLSHRILGARLKSCCEVLLSVESDSAVAVMGSPDDVKLRSSMTLFAQVSDETIFHAVLDRFFDGDPDPRTIELLG